jgi:hypothetical protein
MIAQIDIKDLIINFISTPKVYVFVAQRLPFDGNANRKTTLPAWRLPLDRNANPKPALAA